ncbi:Glutamate-gated chloride channel like protein [Argiope bruennichi]|uniref:Glutamate-gated chloride channel like protein n=1 Tax=Argiope bruennichi TaxID=94029 RepID=A0A8T0EWM5_ARGBR|nr:Glutamate-gated chloride channel like protein [Argiope bruennichi]
MTHRLIARLFVLVSVIAVLGAQRPGEKPNFRALEKRILDSIIGPGRYDSRIRPLGMNNATNGPAVVRVNMFIRSISKIDDVKMEYSVQMTLREQWRDERMQYDDQNGQVRYLTLTDPDKIWKPDLFFSNEKEGHFHNIIMPNVLLRIHPNGDVLYSIRISLVLSCPMDLKYYPLDKQTCSITMVSYGYTTEDLVFLWKKEEPVQLVKKLYLPRFTLEAFLTDYCTSRTNTGEYSCLKVDLQFKREFSYYLIQIYIPCCMLVIPTPAATHVKALYKSRYQYRPGSFPSPPEIDNEKPLVPGDLNSMTTKFRDCEVHMPEEEKHRGYYLCGKWWFSRFPTRSKRIDVVSRICFPLAFAFFNLLYWTTYLLREDKDE